MVGIELLTQILNQLNLIRTHNTNHKILLPHTHTQK